MKYVQTICIALLLTSSVAFAEEAAKPSSARLLAMMGHPSVLPELELLEIQRTAILDIRSRTTEDIKNVLAIRDDKDIPFTEKAKRMQEALAEQEQGITKEIFDKVLLPHQIKRLEQCTWQYAASRDMPKALKEAGVLNEADLLVMQEIQQERMLELREMVQAHQQETLKMVLDKVTPVQRKKWQALVGTPVEFIHSTKTPLPRRAQPHSH